MKKMTRQKTTGAVKDWKYVSLLKSRCFSAIPSACHIEMQAGRSSDFSREVKKYF